MLGFNNFRNLSAITRRLRSSVLTPSTLIPLNASGRPSILDSFNRTTGSGSLSGNPPSSGVSAAIPAPAAESAVAPVRIRTSPNFDGTMGTTSIEANPELEIVIKKAAEKALEAKIAGATDIQVVLTSTLAEVDPTSERAIYNHYGFVAVTATGKTSEGETIALKGEYYVSSGELSMVEISVGAQGVID